jgi:chromosome segregation ATPase
VSDSSEQRSGLRARGEEAVGELAQALVENPIFNSALSRALGAGERAMGAQRSAMGALNFASASDIERLEQRLRSLSGRLETLEDRIDDLTDELAAARRQNGQPSAAD